MKKLLSIVCLSAFLMFSTAAVKADDGNGHDVGYTCTSNVDCTPIDGQTTQPTTNTQDLSVVLLQVLVNLVITGK